MNTACLAHPAHCRDGGFTCPGSTFPDYFIHVAGVGEEFVTSLSHRFKILPIGGKKPFFEFTITDPAIFMIILHGYDFRAGGNKAVEVDND